MNRYETCKRPRDGHGHRDFMEPPPDDHGHKLSPAFTYGRLHPAAYADQDYNTGRFDGRSEQAQSQDLDRGRDLRQDGHRKRGRSDSPGAPHNSRGRDLETRSEHTISVAACHEAVGRGVPWKVAEPWAQERLADDRGWSHDQGHLRAFEGAVREGGREECSSDGSVARRSLPRPDVARRWLGWVRACAGARWS